MEEIIKGNMTLVHSLAALCPDEPKAVQHVLDMDGNQQHWFSLTEPALLVDAAQALHEARARLCMISGYRRAQADPQDEFNLAACYHFELDGVIYNLTVCLSKEHPATPTITPWFFNADWHEREMHELVGIQVQDQPHRERLFLDEKLDAGVLGKMVPLSVMMNGACTTDLWEHILSEKGGKQ